MNELRKLVTAGYAVECYIDAQGFVSKAYIPDGHCRVELVGRGTKFAYANRRLLKRVREFNKKKWD